MSDLYAGVDVGGTTIQVVLGDGENVISSSTLETASPGGPKSVLRRVADAVASLVAAAQGGELRAVGLGLPGRVDRETGVVIFCPNLATQWRDVPAAALLSTALGGAVEPDAVYLINDVRSATLGEARFGRGRGARDMVLFALGTGIGGGIVVDGRLRLGPQGAAGELGHLTIDANGPPCGCGSRGCLETFASGPAIAAHGIRLLRAGLAPRLHEIVNGDASRVTPLEMGQAAREGDELVGEAIRDAAECLGIGISQMVTSLHPELVVLGGGVAQLDDLLLVPVRRVVEERVRMLDLAELRIERSTDSTQMGALGAMSLAGNRGGTEVQA